MLAFLPAITLPGANKNFVKMQQRQQFGNGTLLAPGRCAYGPRRRNENGPPEFGMRAWAGRVLFPDRRMSPMRYLKYALIPVVAVLWLVGLADQLPDTVQTAKYVGISLLMIAVKVI
jgi:hypothetical protein